MDKKYATEFDVVYDYDVLGGVPIYIIDLSGKNGFLAVGKTKKESCHIEEGTLVEAKERCHEIRNLTLMSYDIAEKMREEIGIVKVEQSMPKYRYRFVR